jgi:hypothetical protein
MRLVGSAGDDAEETYFARALQFRYIQTDQFFLLPNLQLYCTKKVDTGLTNVFAVRAARNPITTNNDKIKPYRTDLINSAPGNKSMLTTGINHTGNRIVKMAKRQFLFPPRSQIFRLTLF